MALSTPLALALYSQRKKRPLKAMRRGRRIRRRRGDDVAARRIPMDLLIGILTRLPAKSLMRFKCVSKQWSSLIRCRYFSNCYDLTVASKPRLYIGFVGEAGDSALLSFSSSSSSSAESFDLETTILGVGGQYMDVTLRGLILYTVCAKACIYNPTTRQSVTLPAVNHSIFAEEGLRKSIRYFLGHDPVLDQYKVVCTVVVFSKDFERITSEHWVFVLEAGGSWKRIEFDQHHHRPGITGPCINGVIYYLASTSTYKRRIVYSFDVRSEEFNMIRVPDVLYEFGEWVEVKEYCGKPAIINYTDFLEKGLLDLWILEDAGEWSRKSLGLQPCQMHLLDDIDEIDVDGITLNGEVVMSPAPWSNPYYFLYYDLQKNHLRKVLILSERWFSIAYSCVMRTDNYESIVHLEI
ncbi:hypothetical protein CARUB_v10027527mg [Capsella rubella]|uniref:F-box domain-containing protein n=1 Tax=Capsella rubella TaxID=81985 RepID=R0EYI1_9BRAS|nr:putative F-box protein At5g62660 [Capsella rubella]EOA14347.1 hypothetical protein CARUB_v10027527mg [Capsella rubella]